MAQSHALSPRRSPRLHHRKSSGTASNGGGEQRASLAQSFAAVVSDVLRVAGTAELYEGAHEASPEALSRFQRKQLHGGKQVVCSLPGQLLHITQVPPHLQFNVFIRNGYRCGLCTSACCASALPPQWHNESLNIWTHAFAAALSVHAALTPLHAGMTSSGHTILRLCATLPMVLSFSLSVMYHTFLAHAACSTHHRGPERYHNLLCADVAGVVAVLSVPQVAILHYGFWSHPQLRTFLFIVSYVGALFACGATRSKDQTERAIPLACLVLARWMCVALRCCGFGGHCPAATRIYVTMEAVLAVGGACNALFVPERWFPGKLDYGINSHNIMHVLTTLGAYLLLEALRADAACMASAGGQPGLRLGDWLSF